MTDRGTYALLIVLEVGLRFRIGGLGLQSLPPGYYVYVGSALGGLSSRLRHHLGPKKRLHWHIDYLLAEAEVAQIWYASGSDRLECIRNAALGDIPSATPSVRGFSASDCRCRSHLTGFRNMPRLDLFKQRLRDLGLPPIQLIVKSVPRPSPSR
jgi:sugar fermentation stimulation protein A